MERLLIEGKEEFSWLGKDDDSGDSEDSEQKKLTNQFKKMWLKRDWIKPEAKEEFIKKYGDPEEWKNSI